MEVEVIPWVAMVAGGGFIGGLALLVRGMGGYRTASRIADTSTSRIDSIAAGEVRLTGVIEPAEMVLVSLLQSVPCVYYRATIRKDDDDLGDTEERSVGFRVRDATGSVRVFPRDARVDAPVRFDEATGSLGDEPPGLVMRIGDSVQVGEPDREAAIAELLRVHPSNRPASGGWARTVPGIAADGTTARPAWSRATSSRSSGARCRSATCPTRPARTSAAGPMPSSPAIQRWPPTSRRPARPARLVADPEDAWGNAGIPGFGIGQPIRAAEIDPAAHPLPSAPPGSPSASSGRSRSTPRRSSSPHRTRSRCSIAHGAPGTAAARQGDRFLLGLVGAAVSVISAMVFAIMLNGGFGS